jgi:glycosyltransferase involved in cell wall biosynthesis
MRQAARRAYRGADAVSAVAERYASLVCAAGGSEKVAVFPLGRLLRPQSSLNEESKREGIRLCYVGNLGETYDIGTVLEGVRKLAAEGMAVTLVVAGDGPQRKQVLKAAAEAPDVILFAGYLSDDALDDVLDGSDVGLVPMTPVSWVVVPNKLIDYAAAGLAVINGLANEAQTLLDTYQAGLAYRPGDVGSFMAAVRCYAGDRKLLERHRQGARRLAEERFEAGRIYRAMAGWLMNPRRPLAEEGDAQSGTGNSGGRN